MPKSVKRSKSNGLKSRKRPGKKSRNAKKMRKTRKNKGGSMTSVICNTGLGRVGGVLNWLGSGLQDDPEAVQKWLDCDNVKHKVFQSLKEIRLAKDIINGKTNTLYNTLYTYDITENIKLDTYNGLKTFNLLHIKKNTGLIVNKDEYYLYDENKDIDTFRSIAFTHMNKYVSKYAIFSKRKFHILKFLLKINPEDIITEKINKMEEKINNLDKNDTYNVEKNEKLLKEIKDNKDKTRYIYASFKNAAKYVCEKNESLKDICNGFASDKSTSEEEKQQIIASVRQLVLIPIAEFEKFIQNGVYPLPNKSHF